MDGNFPLAQTLAQRGLFWEISLDKLRQNLAQRRLTDHPRIQGFSLCFPGEVNQRPLPDSNRGWRICNPLPYRLAKGPWETCDSGRQWRYLSVAP